MNEKHLEFLIRFILLGLEEHYREATRPKTPTTTTINKQVIYIAVFLGKVKNKCLDFYHEDIRSYLNEGEILSHGRLLFLFYFVGYYSLYFLTWQECYHHLWPYFIYNTVTWLMFQLEKHEMYITILSYHFLLQISNHILLFMYKKSEICQVKITDYRH